MADRTRISNRQLRSDLCALFGFYLDKPEGDAFASSIAVAYKSLFPKGPFPFGMTDRLAALKASVKAVAADVAFDVTCYAWDDTEEEGGHWTRQREGIVVAKTKAEAEKKLAEAGYNMVEPQRGFQTYYEVDFVPTQILGAQS